MGRIFFYNIVWNRLDISFGIETKTLTFNKQVKNFKVPVLHPCVSKLKKLWRLAVLHVGISKTAFLLTKSSVVTKFYERFDNSLLT